MRFIKLILSGFVIGTIVHASVLAQTKIQVAEKKISKDLTLMEGDKFVIQAKKAKISVKGWSKNTIHVELKLISKHPRKEVAVKELEYNQYSIVNDNAGYMIKNYFHSIDNFSSVKSNLSAEYIIYMPSGQIVEIDNSYGSISVLDATGDVRLKGKFCPIDITNFKGKLTITTNYGDLQLNTIFGELDINSNKSNSTIFQSQGSCSIRSEYGETLLFPGNVLDKINIAGTKSAVRIFINDFNQYSYSLSTTHSEIQLPSGALLSSIKKEGNTVRFEKYELGKPQVKVTTTFNSINIRNK